MAAMAATANPTSKKKMTTSRNKKPYIRASEIGSYVYCRRAWWLRQVAGFEPEGVEARLAEGEEAHLAHGQLVQRSQRQRQAALLLFSIGLLLILAALAFLVWLH